jgi:hypothetical protein
MRLLSATGPFLGGIRHGAADWAQSRHERFRACADVLLAWPSPPLSCEPASKSLGRASSTAHLWTWISIAFHERTLSCSSTTGQGALQRPWRWSGYNQRPIRNNGKSLHSPARLECWPRIGRKSGCVTNLVYARRKASAYLPATAPHAVGLSSAPGTLAPPCAYGFRFGPVHPVSKVLKFFKLFGQRLSTET